MVQDKHSSRGFTLIPALLIMILLSGVAAGLLFMVSNETRMGGNDLEDNMAYYGAESGIEKLTSDLSDLYTASMVPTNAQIQALTLNPPTSAMIPNMNYVETISYSLDANGNPVTSWNTISSGSNQGLYAEIVPMGLQVIASRPTGASVNITRKVEIALIPVFQFGVFCGYDCSYFPGPDFSFGGRVHTNGNLFLASGGSLVFNDQISAFKQILTDELENGHLTSAGYGGTTYVPKATSGCPLNTFPPPVGGTCTAIPGATSIPGDASWSGGIPAIGGAANPNFPSISSGTLNGFFVNSLTGATNLQLPFVKNSCTSNPPPCTDPIAIIRKPLAGETASSTLGTSRLYNKAQIRVLLADTQADLHPERGPLADGQDVQMNPNIIPAGGATEYFATANTGVAGANWTPPYTSAGLSTWTQWPLLGQITTSPALGANPANTGAWLRVEYLNNTGNWVGITQEWLAFGFGRALNIPPTTPSGGAGQNATNPNAILILQQQRANGLATTGGGSQNNWYPINFYDTREGEMRDEQQTLNTCAVNGIMNAVELDVGNLALWLKGTIPGSGKNVNLTAENGYVLYFSDHRGMLVDPNPSNGGQTPANTISGESGLEDVVNWTVPLADFPAVQPKPDGVLETTATKYYTYSPEDVDQNGFLDAWGARDIGYGFGVNTNTALPLTSYVRINNCATIGRANMVTGARHALRLVDGGMSNTGNSYLPVRWDNNAGGFTVASENPVYVYGNYNSAASDPFWTNNASNTTPHAAAAIIADAVTVLSNQWSDLNSLTNSTSDNTPNNYQIHRAVGADAYYRMAVAGGKNIPFPQPTWANSPQDFGTDGGLHNFLRYLEDWSPPAGTYNLWYNGSLVSMYYAEYATGAFKCCDTVYNPPARKYYFDTLFLNPANLPPGTPMFQDVVNLSYHQNFTPQ